MSSYGTRTIATIGRSIRASADGHERQKAAGITLDWATVTAVTVATTLPDGTVVNAGDSYIRYGTVLNKITASGKYGPVDTSASDGRHLVTNAVRGDSFILDETVVMSQGGSDHPKVFDGGLVFKGRLLIGGTNQPTEANIETMFPDITFVND
jgi:hypothetical protein